MTAAGTVQDLFGVEIPVATLGAQTRRRTMDDLIANTPADGMVTGIGNVNADLFGADKSRCVVMASASTTVIQPWFAVMMPRGMKCATSRVFPSGVSDIPTGRRPTFTLPATVNALPLRASAVS